MKGGKENYFSAFQTVLLGQIDAVKIARRNPSKCGQELPFSASTQVIQYRSKPLSALHSRIHVSKRPIQPMHFFILSSHPISTIAPMHQASTQALSRRIQTQPIHPLHQRHPPHISLVSFVPLAIIPIPISVSTSLSFLLLPTLPHPRKRRLCCRSPTS